MQKIYELQISHEELYAFEPLLCDTIYLYQSKIAELRKKLGIPSENPNQTEMLIEIQELEGKIVILQDLLDQMIEQGL